MKPRAMNVGGAVMEPPKMVGVMVLLDRSGSMNSIKDAMGQAFGEFVATQKAEQPDGMWLTLHQFDSDGYDKVYERTPLVDVGSLNLMPRGDTPLVDSLHKFLSAAKKIKDDPADETDRLLLVIVTDGGENCSRKHSWKEVRELFNNLESDDFETIWLGTTAALLDAEQELPKTFAGGSGTYKWEPTAQGVTAMSAAMSGTVSSYRSGGIARATLATHQSPTGKSPLKPPKP